MYPSKEHPMSGYLNYVGAEFPVEEPKAEEAPKPAKKREVQAVFGGASTLLFDQASRLPSVRSTSSQKLCRRA